LISLWQGDRLRTRISRFRWLGEQGRHRLLGTCVPRGDSRTCDVPETADIPLRGLLHEFQGRFGQRRDGIDHPFDRPGFGDIRVREAGKDVGIAQPACEANPDPGSGDCGIIERRRNEVVEVPVEVADR